MADRIRPVHSSSRSRTRAPHYNSVYFAIFYAETHLSRCRDRTRIVSRGNRDGRFPRRQAHTIARLGSHPQASAYGKSCNREYRAFIWSEAAAQLLPGPARRFPLFAPLLTRGGVSFRLWGRANGEIATWWSKPAGARP